MYLWLIKRRSRSLLYGCFIWALIILIFQVAFYLSSITRFSMQNQILKIVLSIKLISKFFSLDRESTYVDFFCMAWKIPACWDWISWSNLLRVMKNYRRPPACGWLFVEEIIHRRCPRSWDPDRPANLGNNFSNPIIIRLRWGCYTCQVAVSYSVVMGRTMFNVRCPFDWILK